MPLRPWERPGTAPVEGEIYLSTDVLQSPDELSHVATPSGGHLRGGARVDSDPKRSGSHGWGSLGSPAVKPRVLVLRGHQVNPWELGPWEELGEQFDVRYLATRSGWFDATALSLPAVQAPALRDLLPPGRIGDMAVRIPGDRYLRLADRLDGASIVHAQELGYWYSMQAARLKARLGFKLVLTVWETLPLLGAYRNVRTRRYRRIVLSKADLFLAASERARQALILEGASAEKVVVSPPGIRTDSFRGVAGKPAPDAPPIILSPGRLVWEKGHQDVLRAVAALRRGLGGHTSVPSPRVLIVGAGPHERTLRRHAEELGIGDLTEFRSFVPHSEMPALFASASCVVLASLAKWYWEEQFGMVLAEALASGTPICAAGSGAIPEVLHGQGDLFTPGDWLGLANLLASGPLSRPPGTRAEYDPELVRRYSNTSAAARLAEAYDAVLA